MADSFFGTEFDNVAAPETEQQQFAYTGFEEQPQYTDEFGEQVQTNGGLDHDAFGPDSVFATDGAQEYIPAAAEYGAAEYVGAPVSAFPADESFFSSAPAVAELEPETDDPRVQWNIKNREYLAEKDQNERAGKEALLQAAREYFDNYYQTRNTTLQQRKDTNREDEKEKTATALPQGNTPWEKVHSLLNFNSDVPAKDVSRYKSTLFTCKNNNVPVHTPSDVPVLAPEAVTSA